MKNFMKKTWVIVTSCFVASLLLAASYKSLMVNDHNDNNQTVRFLKQISFGSATYGLLTNAIGEYTADTGVTIGGLLIKDGSISGVVMTTGTPVDNQLSVFTDASTVEGTTGLTYDGSYLHITGDLGVTGTRVVKGWFTDIQSTNSPILDDLTASELVASSGTKQLESLAVATYPSLTEVSYLKGVTSAVQTQLSSKVTGPSGGTGAYMMALFANTTGQLLQASAFYSNASGDLLPITDTSQDLGSTTKTFQDAFFKDEDGTGFTARKLAFSRRQYSEEAALTEYTVSNSVTGGVWTITITEVGSTGLLEFVLDGKKLINTGATMSVDATALAGSDAAPETVYVYVRNDGADAPELIATRTDPDAAPEVVHAHVANYKAGAVTASDVTTYGKAESIVEMYKIATNVYHRAFAEGALYVSGLDITAVTDNVTIGTGTYKIVFDLVTTAEKVVGTDGLFYISSAGAYSTSTDFSFGGEYGDGVAISDGKSFNVVLGVMENDTTRIMALVQTGTIEEYGDFNKAFEDKKNQTVYQPSDSFLKKIFVPVCRIIVDRTGATYSLEQFDDGKYYQDLRGVIGAGGGSSSSVGASVSLDNLVTPAINTSLISDTDSTDDLGSSSIKWLNLFADNLGSDGTRIGKGWFTDITCANAIVGSTTIIGAATMTLGSDVDLDVYYRSSNVLTRLAKGTASQVLSMNGDATAIEWAAAGAGDVTKVGTPADSQVGVWTGDGTIEGDASFTYDQTNMQFTGDLGSTGTKITKGWFTDLTVVQAIAGSVTGNAGTVTVDATTTDTTCFVGIFESSSGSLEPQTDATLIYDADTGILTTTLTGNVTGDCTGSSGSCTGESATVATITTLAPDTATTQATQGNITTCAALTTIGTVTTGGLGSGAVLGPVTMTLGSDVDLDIYYRSSNILTRLAKGTASQVLAMNSDATALEWATSAAFDITGLDAITVPAYNDYVPVYDASTTANKKITLADLRKDLINEDATAAVTLALTDVGGTVRMTSASANEVTIPANAAVAFATEVMIAVKQVGAGSTTITAAAGVTLNGVSAGSIEIGSQYGIYMLEKVDTDAWEANGGVQSNNGWVAMNDITRASDSTFTVTDNTTNAAIFIVGRPIRYADTVGTWSIGYVTDYTTGTITLAGAPMTTSFDAYLQYGEMSKLIQMDVFVSGTYGDTVNTDLLASDMNTYFKWQLGKAYCVAFSGIHKTVDTGAEPKINVQVNNAIISTTDTNKGIQLGASATWVDNAAVAVNVTNYDINRGEEVEINCTEVGGTADASDLTVSLVFVLQYIWLLCWIPKKEQWKIIKWKEEKAA